LTNPTNIIAGNFDEEFLFVVLCQYVVITIQE